MNRKTILIIITMLLFIFLGKYSYYSNKVDTVLLSGKVFGFNIQDAGYEEKRQNIQLISTSLKKVGTMTFIKKDNCFSGLGHKASDIINSYLINGDCYNVYLDEIQKARENVPGKIIAELNENEKIGELQSTSNYGVFGKVNERVSENLIEIKTQNRYRISKGKADIFIDMDGNGLKKYEVQITNINHFSKNRNLELIVTSENLIEKTGGIIQGMSGAPIVQDGKLIGAINFVSSSNPRFGYGIFADKLL